MGGKALNKFGVFTERKNTDEFNQVGYELINRVFYDLTLFTSVVKCYHTKADHGDLDLLIDVPANTNVNWVDYIRKTYQPQAINANGGVYSFDYKNFQIDFIPIPTSKWETAKTYYSYDPLGNIMGKTFHKFNLSYGWEGLTYKYRNDDGRNCRDILLTTDARKIFEFGGYDYDAYLKGFDTLKDIFDFCIGSKYFDAEMFEFENLKSIDKKRNRKRGSYHLFLKYLQDNAIVTKFNFNRDKNSYIPMINIAFPEAKLLERLKELEKIDNINKIISQKFNGDIVMSWLPDLKGKELGQAMMKFKNALGDEYNDFILNSNYNNIHNYFMSVYNGRD